MFFYASWAINNSKNKMSIGTNWGWTKKTILNYLVLKIMSEIIVVDSRIIVNLFGDNPRLEYTPIIEHETLNLI